LGLGPEKRVGHRGQELTPLNIEIEETGQRKKRLLDHVDVEVDIETAQFLDFLLGEGQRRPAPQTRPVIPVEVEVIGVLHV
jgi:hypothetical protein